MFRSRTGWVAVLVSVIGALTAVDVMPILSAFLAETFGAKIAHGVGAALTLIGTITAKLSQPQADTPTEPAA